MKVRTEIYERQRMEQWVRDANHFGRCYLYSHSKILPYRCYVRIDGKYPKIKKVLVYSGQIKSTPSPPGVYINHFTSFEIYCIIKLLDKIYYCSASLERTTYTTAPAPKPQPSPAPKPQPSPAPKPHPPAPSVGALCP